MSFFNIRHIKATRKPHRCYWCGEQIPAGQSRVYTSTIVDREMCGTTFHPECYAASMAWCEKNKEYELPEEGTMSRGEPDYKPEPCNP